MTGEGKVTRDGGAPTAPKEPTGPPATEEELAQRAHDAEVAAPPVVVRRPGEWLRDNLFSSWANGLVTVVFGSAVGYAAYRALRFVFVTGRWEIVERNLLLFMVFRFPRDDLWRLWGAAALVALSVGVAAGVTARARRLEAEVHEHVDAPSLTTTLRRLAPIGALLAVLVLLVSTWLPVALVVAVGAAGAAGYVAGQRVPPRRSRWANLGALAGVVLGYVVISQFGGVGYPEWGGLLLTVFLAAGGIVLSFPLGVALALGRRSTLPAVRLVCVGYIELIRGVPLLTLLFMAALVIGLFFPPGATAPEVVSRALIAIVLFTAAYLAEIVRGGLQSVPTGQYEAAQALGLSPWSVTRRIVLPQALRAVVPAIVGQFISLFKDTSLVFIIGLTDLLAVARNVTAQPDFLGRGLTAETLAFAGFVYWVGSYTMSRESQRLERRLGVGTR